MSTRNCFAVAGAVLLLAAAAAAQDAGPNLGQEVSAADIAAWDISIPPDGGTLPPGSGTVAQGAEIYAAQCESCHGPGGTGGPVGGNLTGGVGTLASAQPAKTVNSYWPYATTVYDYIHRAMPLNAPQSLTPDQVYALVAYILSVDGIVGADAVMDAQTLPQVEMPNRDGFITAWPDPR